MVFLALEQVTAEAAARNFVSPRKLAKLGFKPIESFIEGFDGEASNAMPDC